MTVKESEISRGLVRSAQRALKKICTLAQFWLEKSRIRPMPKIGDQFFGFRSFHGSPTWPIAWPACLSRRNNIIIEFSWGTYFLPTNAPSIFMKKALEVWIFYLLIIQLSQGNRKRRGKHPVTLCECDCGEIISGSEVERGEGFIECNKAGCETRWVSLQ